MRKVDIASYDEVVVWGVRAHEWCLANNHKWGLANCRKALAAIKAPFLSEYWITLHYNKTWADFSKDVEKFIIDRDVDARVEEGVRNMLGKGVSTNKRPPANFEELRERMKTGSARRLEEYTQETCRNVIIDVDHVDEPILSIQMGDMHLGSTGTDYNEIEWCIDQAKRRDIKVFLNQCGDVGDQMMFLKMRNEGRASGLTLLEEWHLMIGYLRMMRDTEHFLGCCAGNHDLWGHKASGVGALDSAMEMLGREIPYAQYELLLDLVVRGPSDEQLAKKMAYEHRHDPGWNTVVRGARMQREQTYKFEIRHMVKGHSMWTPQHGVMRHIHFNHIDRDIVVAGHTHRSGIGKKKLYGKLRYGIQTGAFKKLDDYGKELDFADENLDAHYGVLLWPNERRIQVMETVEAVRSLEGWHAARKLLLAPPPIEVRGRRRKRSA